MSNETTFKPAGDAVELTRLALAARSSFTQLALYMLPDLKRKRQPMAALTVRV